MTIELVKEISGEVFKTILLASGPVLIVSVIVGLVISFFQTITQIQEFTLTFVPKIIAVFLCIFLFLPWMSRILMDFTINLIDKIPVYIK